MEAETLTVELDPQDRELVEFAAETSGHDTVSDYLRGAALLTAVQRCRHVEDQLDGERAEEARKLGQDWADRQKMDVSFFAIE